MHYAVYTLLCVHILALFPSRTILFHQCFMVLLHQYAFLASLCPFRRRVLLLRVLLSTGYNEKEVLPYFLTELLPSMVICPRPPNDEYAKIPHPSFYRCDILRQCGIQDLSFRSESLRCDALYVIPHFWMGFFMVLHGF